MADITAKRGPIDPNDYVTNQGIATQGQIKGLDRDIRYAETQPSTWDSVMGGIKDVMKVGESALNMANSYKNLDVKDTQIKVAEEQIEASKLNRQKTELEMENVKQTMRMKSIEFDMALQEKKEQNNFLTTTSQFLEAKDYDGLQQYMASDGLSQAIKQPNVTNAIRNHLKNLDSPVDTGLIDVISDMGISEKDRLQNSKAQIDIEKSQLDLILKKNQVANMNKTSDPFDIVGTTTGKGSSGGKANPELAKMNLEYRKGLFDLYNTVRNYDDPNNKLGKKIITGLNELGLPITDLHKFEQGLLPINIEKLDGSSAYDLKRMTDLLKNPDTSAWLPKDTTESDLKNMSIIKLHNTEGKAVYIPMDSNEASMFTNIKNNQLLLNSLGYKGLRGRGKNADTGGNLPDFGPGVGVTNEEKAGNMLTQLGTSEKVEAFKTMNPGKQKDFIEKELNNIKKEGLDTAVVNKFLKEASKLQSESGWNKFLDWASEGSRWRFTGNKIRSTPEERAAAGYEDAKGIYQKLIDNAPGKNENEKRKAVNNDLLRYIIRGSLEGTKYPEMVKAIANASNSGSLDYETRASNNIEDIDVVIKENPDLQINKSDIPSPMVVKWASDTNGTISIKDLPKQVAKNFTTPFVRDKLVKDTERKLEILDRDYNQGGRTSDKDGTVLRNSKPKSKEEIHNEATKIVERAIYELVMRAKEKGYSYFDLANILSRKEIKSLEQFQTILDEEISSVGLLGDILLSTDSFKKRENEETVYNALKE